MSFKFDSMMIILNKVDSGEKVTIQSLKEELQVSERTVHRYLETLQLSGYPLFFDRQLERYAFPEGYGLTPRSPSTATATSSSRTRRTPSSAAWTRKPGSSRRSRGFRESRGAPSRAG